MIPVTIDTVYENENAGRAFSPGSGQHPHLQGDLGSFVKFIGTSLLSFLIDQGLAWILATWCSSDGGDRPRRNHLGVGAAGAAGVLRVQFLMNRSFVFK
jgi:MYXO-CTERM domain-containing protein